MIVNRHETFVIDKVLEHKYCGKSFFQLVGGSYEPPFPISPTEGKHSLESCTGCKRDHETIINAVKERFDKFPNCCDGHKRLNSPDGFEFKRSDFGNNFPKDFADKVLFTFHHIINRLADENWYVEITDYLDYALTSLGSFPPGYGGVFCSSEYLSYLDQLIVRLKNDLLKESEDDPVGCEEGIKKLVKIVSYINGYVERNNDSQGSQNNDISILLSTYEEWLNIFPFDLPFFGGLKEHYQKTIPLINGTHHNKYLGMTFGKSHTRNGLITLLIERTKLLLTKINGLGLYEKGKLTNAEKLEIDLIVQKRNLELKTLGQKRNDTTKRYKKVIQEWFKGEIDFIGKIKPLLKKNEQTDTSESLNEFENPYPEMFEDYFAYKVFDRWHENHKGIKGKFLANYSFIYRKMHKNGIHEMIRPEMFKTWLSNEPYSVVLDHSLKTIANCKTDNRELDYSKTIEIIKSKTTSV